MAGSLVHLLLLLRVPGLCLVCLLTQLLLLLLVLRQVALPPVS
jgi:hypothetical protein